MHRGILTKLIIPGVHDAEDVFKVMGSKVKVIENISWKCAFLVEADWTTFCDQRPFSVSFILLYVVVDIYHKLGGKILGFSQDHIWYGSFR